jgi:ribosomal-protein-alanine N-acetyltransferase
MDRPADTPLETDPLPLQTGRLILRRFEERDVPAVLHLSSDPAVHAAAAELGSTEPEALAYIRAQRALAPFELGALFDLAIVRRHDGELIGMATLVRSATTAEIGYALHTTFRGHGYATEAAAALVETAFTELAVNEVQAQVAPTNTPSRAVLERVGMQPVTDGHIAVREASDLAYAIGRDDWDRQAH